MSSRIGPDAVDADRGRRRKPDLSSKPRAILGGMEALIRSPAPRPDADRGVRSHGPSRRLRSGRRRNPRSGAARPRSTPQRHGWRPPSPRGGAGAPRRSGAHASSPSPLTANGLDVSRGDERPSQGQPDQGLGEQMEHRIGRRVHCAYEQHHHAPAWNVAVLSTLLASVKPAAYAPGLRRASPYSRGGADREESDGPTETRPARWSSADSRPVRSPSTTAPAT